MSAYLKFFALERSPFDDAGQPSVVLGTKALRDAFEAIRSGLADDAARICVSGAAGLGKTTLARSLPKLLGEEAQVALVLDPSGSWDSLRDSIASQWGLAAGGLARARLLAAARKRRLVLVVDQAQRTSTDLLDHIDVMLSYRTQDDRPVVQCVLLANLSASDQAGPPPLLWWLDRMHTLQLEFAPLPRNAIGPYIEKHLARAGWQGKQLFTPEATQAIHALSGGIPGEVGRLCEQLLAAAAEQDLLAIDADFVCAICDPGGQLQMRVREAPPGTSLGKEREAPAKPGPGPAKAGTRTAPPIAADSVGRGPNADEPVGGPIVAAVGVEPVERETETRQRGSGIGSLEAYLSRPATPEELRALFGSGLVRYARTVAMIAAAVVLAAIGLSVLLSGDDDGTAPSLIPASPKTTGSTQASDPARVPEAGPGGQTSAREAGDGSQPILARMRGPVRIENGQEVVVEPTPLVATERSGAPTGAAGGERQPQDSSDSPTKGP